MGIITKTLGTIGKISDAAVTGFGKGVIGTGKVTGKVGKGVGKKLLKDMTEEELKDASLYERILGKKLNAGGVALLTGGTMAVSTVGAISNNGLSKFQKMGNTSVGDNLDRLVSYDGSGFVQNINRVSKGNPAVMQDIVQNTFDNPNQFGVSGDIVFALHNMREG